MTRVRKAPAKRGVVHDLVPARKRVLGLRHDERRAAHRLDPARDDDVGVAGHDRVAGGDNGRQPRGAEAVQRDPGDGVRQAGQQHGHARDVSVVLAGLVRASEIDVVDC